VKKRNRLIPASREGASALPGRDLKRHIPYFEEKKKKQGQLILFKKKKLALVIPPKGREK